MTGEREVRILIAASGTGGHLFPAVYIGRAFKRLAPNAVVEFIGSGRPLEEKVIGGAGFKLHTLPVVGVKHRGLRGLFQSVFSMPSAFIACRRLFKSFKPDVVVGVGGYVTFVPVTLAFLSGIPTWIHEAELQPGMANKILSRYASRISIAFKDARIIRPVRTTYTGHPVREDLRDVAPGLQPNDPPRKILVLGGSQGARALDEALKKLAGFMKENGLELWHQSRPENLESAREAYEKAGLNVRVEAFIDNMTEAFSWSDLLITRSGAGAVMEAGVVNRPTIFVPYPHAQGDHQSANAMTLVREGKALLVKEGDNFTERLKNAISDLIRPENYHAMKSGKYEARSLDAANQIAAGCLSMIGEKSPQK